MTKLCKVLIYKEFERFKYCVTEREAENLYFSTSGYLRSLYLNGIIKECVYDSLYNILSNIYICRNVFLTDDQGNIIRRGP